MAVEIDPDIIRIGKELHPEKPYNNARVDVVNQDARTFFQTSRNKYDVLLFGLLDAHTLSSSYSNVRLDNYVYTVESLRKAMNLLKTDGLLFMIFEVSDDFIGARLYKMLLEVSGQEPVGLLVRSRLRGWGGYCFLVGNRKLIEQRIAADPNLKKLVADSRQKFTSWAQMNVESTSDDWPYLYLQNRRIPKLFLFIFALLILLSYGAIRAVVGKAFQIRWHFFFLGAAFLLLEVQNISKFALLFGATWTVNTVVISMILLMILLANYVCVRKTIQNRRLLYAALFLSLLLSYFMRPEFFAGLTGFWKFLIPSALLTIPIFFAGIIFSTSFAKTQNRSAAFASNLLGAMVGGVSECLSFLVGIQALLLVCAFFYILAAKADA